MLQIDEILRLLAEKKKLFLQFEQASERMCFAPVDEIETFMQQRLTLQHEIEKTDDALSVLYRNAPGAKEAASNQGARSDLSPELTRIYDASLDVKSVVDRILQNEPMIGERIELEKKELLRKIEENKQSSASIANRYYQSLQAGTGRPYLPNMGKKV